MDMENEIEEIKNKIKNLYKMVESQKLESPNTFPPKDLFDYFSEHNFSGNIIKANIKNKPKETLEAISRATSEQRIDVKNENGKYPWRALLEEAQYIKDGGTLVQEIEKEFCIASGAETRELSKRLIGCIILALGVSLITLGGYKTGERLMEYCASRIRHNYVSKMLEKR